MTKIYLVLDETVERPEKFYIKKGMKRKNWRGKRFRINFRVFSKYGKETWPEFQLIDSVRNTQRYSIFIKIIYHCLSMEVFRM